MKKVIGIIVIIVCLGVFIVHTNTEPREKIVLGFTAPLSGPLAEYGEAFRNGVIMAQEELGEASEKFDIVFEDTQYDPKLALSAFKKLTDVNHAQIVMDWGTATGDSITPTVANSNAVFLTNTIDAAATTKSDYVIRYFYSPDDIAQILWKYFRENDYKNIGVTNLNIAYFNKVIEALERQKEDGENVIRLETYNSFTENDFRTGISKTKTKDIDIIGIFLGAGQISQYYKQMQQLGLIKPTFGSDFFESETEITNSAGLMNGSVYANIGVDDDFSARYQKRFGNTNQISFAGNSYDIAKILMSDVSYKNKSDIKDSITKIAGLELENGIYTYIETQNDRYIKPTLHLKQIIGNKIITQ